MNRRIVVNIIRGLLLATLLLCATNVTPRESAGRSLEKNRASGVAPALASSSAAQVFGGGLIAFSADDGQIYVMNADGSDARRLTDGSSGVVNRYPSFSPDGSRIAFIRDVDRRNDHALCVVNVDGSGLQQISSSFVALGEPAWSPDASKIAFVRGYDTTAGGFANITGCGSEIYVIDLASGLETNLTQGAGGVDPAWSPDGTHIAFSSFRDDNYEIYTMASDGSDVRRLTYTGWAEAEPAWSPDGSRIAYTAHLAQSMLDCGFMSTGLSGISNEGQTSVYVMTTDGANQNKLALTNGGVEPTWSPDSARLALVINAKVGWQIYVTDLNGTSLARLTWDSTQKSSPSWSRTGKRR
jgi:TolB protein